MAKSRTANRAWRGRMKKYIEKNPEVQAEVNAIRVSRLEKRAEEISEFQDALTQQSGFIQAEIARLSPTETEEPSEAQQ